MNTKTLTSAWTPSTNVRALVADQWVLGPYTIVRVVGDAHYTLLGAGEGSPLAMGSLQQCKEAGAALWAQEIAEMHARQILPAFEEGDIQTSDQGSIVLFHPVTQGAKEWIDEHVQEDAQWFGGSLVVEKRYSPYLIEGMIEAGLQFGA